MIFAWSQQVGKKSELPFEPITDQLMFDGLHMDAPRWLSGFGLGVLAALLMVSSLQAQPAAFQEAKKAYEMYNYEKAVDLFSKVARNSSMNSEVRREALQYLGQIHIGRDQREEAREALEQLVSLEPPVVELNPNRQPPPLMELYYQVRKEKKGDYSVEKEGPGLQTIAIMDFRNSSVDQRERFASLSKGFPSMIINYLNGSTDLKVIERERIQWLLDELKLQQKADVVDQSTAVRTGKLLGATTVLFGNYIVHEDQMRLSARLVKVETGEILLSEKVTGEPDEFFELVQDLSSSVTRSINVTMEETDVQESGGTSLLDAQLAYSNGLGELENGNYRKAREHFQQALKHDPNYSLAQDRLESLKPMLASSETDTTGTSEETGGTRDHLNQ